MTRMILFGAAAATLASTACLEAQDAQGYPQDGLCYTQSGELCPDLPVDLTGLTVVNGYSPNTDVESPDTTTVQQQNFDYFAWQMFVALNWPSDGSGNPSGSITDELTLDAPRVWESYPGIADVFGAGPQVPGGCNGGRLALGETSKMTDSGIESSSFTEPFTSSPLIDVDGNYVLYDIRLNETEAKYLTDNGLTTKSGQEAFKASHPDGWDLPRGVVQDGTPIPGAMEIKTSWRIVTDPSNPMGYYTVPGVVHVEGKNSATGDPLCLDVTFGLVGMHIMQKITTPEDFSNFWVWGTFEHVKNAPNAADAPVSQSNRNSTVSGNDPVASCPVPDNAGSDWAFFNPDCTSGGNACAPNQEPAIVGEVIWQSKPPYAKSALSDGQYGTQVTRCWDVYESARNVDDVFQTALEGSPWANYQLIGAQWAQAQVVEYPDPLKPFPAPIYLVNSTLETYLQNDPVIDPSTGAPNKNASGSCIICHDIGTDTAGNKTDFSFLGFYAQ
ncbi:hypothetical protein ACOXXX_04245 [Thalassococcus sp. BH17M4-6]|uniref:hypothetical protein n=1 Tax=Thalassococcus sp. BH17M4-6 TaxID=3413148 RepID=UPI003BD101B5